MLRSHPRSARAGVPFALGVFAIASVLSACSSDDATSTNGSNGESSSGGGGGNASSGGTTSGPGSSGAPGSSGTPGSSGNPAAGSRASCKRGLAYGYHSEADMKAIAKGVSWWYNWAFEPDEGVKTSFKSLGLEYVPMVWGKNIDTKAVEDHVLPGSATLLGFNEPNFYEQANLSAAEAASRWPSVQAVADARGLALVSPAVNFCGGGCHATDPFAYLDAFFAACQNCRVDAIGVHVYVGCKGENGNHAQWMINHLKTYEQRFTQPIWLTEFACSDAKNADEQKAFLTDAVTYLESDPRIVKYAWFAGRADNVPHVDLLGGDGQLTPLGEAYVNAPQAPGCSL